MSSSIMRSIFGTPPRPRAQPVTVIPTSTASTGPIFTGPFAPELPLQSTTPANQSPSFTFLTLNSAPASPSVSPSESPVTVTTTSLITSAVITHIPASPTAIPPQQGVLLGTAIVGAVLGGIVALFLPLLLWRLFKKRRKHDFPSDTAQGDEKFYNLFQSRPSITTPLCLPQMDKGLMNVDRKQNPGILFSTPLSTHSSTNPGELFGSSRDNEIWHRDAFSQQSTDSMDGFSSINLDGDSHSLPFYQLNTREHNLPLYNTDCRGPVGSHEATPPLDMLRGLRTRVEPWRRGYSEQPVVREVAEISQSISPDRNSYTCTVSTLPLYHE